MLFNFCGGSEVGFGELNAYSSLPITLRTFWSNPHHFSVDRDFLGLAHELQQDKYFLTQHILLVRGNKETAMPNEGHVCRIQQRPIFYRQ